VWYRILEGLCCVVAGAFMGILLVILTAARALGKGFIELVKGLIL